MLTQGVGITIDHDLACFRSLIGILPIVSFRQTHIDAFFRRATGSAYEWAPSDDG